MGAEPETSLTFSRGNFSVCNLCKPTSLTLETTCITPDILCVGVNIKIIFSVFALQSFHIFSNNSFGGVLSTSITK